MTTIAPERVTRTEDRPDPHDVVEPDIVWVAVVWNDPVNLMSYVRRVLQKLFGHPYELAHKLMMQVHEEGRAAVTEGTREHVEIAVQRLHEHGLWATVERG